MHKQQLDLENELFKFHIIYRTEYSLFQPCVASVVLSSLLLLPKSSLFTSCSCPPHESMFLLHLQIFLIPCILWKWTGEVLDKHVSQCVWLSLQENKRTEAFFFGTHEDSWSDAEGSLLRPLQLGGEGGGLMCPDRPTATSHESHGLIPTAGL